MEDPWGDPWAADAAPATVEPARAATAAFLDAPGGLLGRQPDAAAASSPWEGYGDAWADVEAGSGWNVGSGLEPSAAVFAHQPLPDPWANAPPALDADARTLTPEPVGGPRTDDVETNPPRLESPLRLPPTDPLDTDAKNVWTAQEPAAIEEPPPPPAPGVPDAPTRPIVGARQPSKVQGLVEMFDGIAKRNTSPAATAGRPAVAHEGARPESALARGSCEPPATRPQHRAESSPDSWARLSADGERYGTPWLEGEAETTTGTGSVQDQKRRGKSNPRHIEYPIDMSRLDDLFPSDSAQLPEPALDLAAVNNDLFTSVSERKAWYRISRFGSARRHDQGDPDDYVRVAWAASRVRERTVELVRRWMEQGSLVGRVPGRRVGLGGGSMFNWDSAAAPVEIAELLRRRGGGKTPEAHAVTGEESTIVARGSLPAAATPPLSFGAGPSGGAPALDHEESLAWRLAAPPDASPAMPALAVLSSAEAPLAFEGSDDDDWGDMVSPTPVSTKGPSGGDAFQVERPVMNGSSPLGHSAQHSLGGVSTHENKGPNRTRKDVVSMTGENPSLSWASIVGLDHETIKPTLAPATHDEKGLEQDSTRGSHLGTDHASLLHSTLDISTNDSKADMGIISGKESAESDEVVARILRNLPDLSYMLR